MGTVKSVDFRGLMSATATSSLPAGKWVAERKWDGIRVGIRKRAQWIKMWSRLGNEQDIPPQILIALQQLPDGYYDGELIMPGGRSSDVKALMNHRKLQLVLFDLLETTSAHDCQPLDLISQPWSTRRSYLETAFLHLQKTGTYSSIHLCDVVPVASWDDAQKMVEAIWEQGGEGIMLKHIDAKYRCDKRGKEFLKVKELQSATLTILGFCPSEGEVRNLGDYGTVVLQDEDGVVVPVKILDDEERLKLEKRGSSTRTWKEVRLISGKKLTYFIDNSATGTNLCIEFQNRTTDGSYRHPRWNHFAAPGHVCS